MESSRSLRDCEVCRLPVIPTFVFFLLRTFDRGLSIVDADDPEKRDGVCMVVGTSSLGRRDVLCMFVFENDAAAGTAGPILP
jgi:hypothetical protein